MLYDPVVQADGQAQPGLHGVCWMWVGILRRGMRQERVDCWPLPLTCEPVMAKPNYAFEKRQRELAAKKKKEEKLARKQAGNRPAEEQAAEPVAASE